MLATPLARGFQPFSECISDTAGFAHIVEYSSKIKGTTPTVNDFYLDF